MAVPTEIQGVLNEVNNVISGKEDVVLKIMMTILARGHILLDDVPGVGKTSMAVAFSNAMLLKQNRLQFTPDILPSDVVGFSMYNKSTGEFEYKPGPVNCNLFLADEINRTSPKTQSALLEVMEEGNVTVDGNTYELEPPFIVIATENPLGSSGTQPLPDSQLDRFMVRLSMGYPDARSEFDMLKSRADGVSAKTVKPVINGKMLVSLQEKCDKSYVDDKIYDYVIALVNATRNHEGVKIGLSPRASIAVVQLAKACAFVSGRDYVIPEDVQKIFPDAACHRLVLNTAARLSAADADAIIRGILADTPAAIVR